MHTRQSGYESDEDFPFKISTGRKVTNPGGMSTENQGRPVPGKNLGKISTQTFNPPVQATFSKKMKWTFAVAVTKSVYDERDNQQTIDDFFSISPTEGTNRNALLLGINEQTMLSDGSDSDIEPTVRKKRRKNKSRNKKITNLNTHNMPVHIQMAYQQANWVTRDKHQKPVSIYEVRKEYQNVKSKDKKRAKNLRRYERARSHYPFGAMRSLLFNHAESKDFLESMEERAGNNKKIMPPLFVLIQDADYIDLNEKPVFYTSLLQDLPDNMKENYYKIISETYDELSVDFGQTTLLDRYDILIKQHYALHRRWPDFLGGAHVYSCKEKVDHASSDKSWRNLDMLSCKQWTRFGSELGNAMKHLIGMYNPYSLYFHEPNTLMRWQGKSKAVNFGDKSEMNELLRNQLKLHASDARECAKFHAAVVVATSQKRSTKPFTVKFFGTFSDGKFHHWTDRDMRSLQDMPQEILTSNAWSSAVCTAFAKQKSKTKASEVMQLIKDKWSIPNKDARALIARLYNLYDPHYLAYRYDSSLLLTKTWSAYCEYEHRLFLENMKKPKKARTSTCVKYSRKSFLHVLDRDHYDALTPKSNDPIMREIKMLLKYIYHDTACKQILTLAQITGELRRSMFEAALLGNAKKCDQP